MQASRIRLLVVDSSKFGLETHCTTATLADFDAVITDQPLSDRVRAYYSAKGVRFLSPTSEYDSDGAGHPSKRHSSKSKFDNRSEVAFYFRWSDFDLGEVEYLIFRYHWLLSGIHGSDDMMKNNLAC